jgi:putative FmdB family regulatory protein
MPLYDFMCGACGHRFEARVDPSKQPTCPSCGRSGAERVFSPFAGPFTVGRLRGVAARRSEGKRRAREEKRRERREKRRKEQGSA